MISNNESKKNNILIIGKGYLGIKLYMSLLLDKHDVSLISREVEDYHNLSKFAKYLLNNNIDTVINCSGFTGRPNVDEAEIKKELCWNLNVEVPLSLNSLCNDLNIRYVHVSSGCIYNGYDKEFTEEDSPNFGLFNESSFYSKTKHAFERLSKDLDSKILRIRMPVDGHNTDRNYLMKLLKYDNLIPNINSKTFIPDFTAFVKKLLNIDDSKFWTGQDIYNVVNPNPLSTQQVLNIMIGRGLKNPNWKIIELKDLNTVAPRSNCVLNCDKAQTIHKMKNEVEAITESVYDMYDYINSERN